MIPHRLTAIAVTGILLSLSARALPAQTASDYGRLIDTYRNDPAEAITTLVEWSPRAVNEAVDAHAILLTSQQRIAAAMLHSDLAAQISILAPARATFHVEAARRLLDNVPDRAVFVERWYSFVAMVYIGSGRFQEAARIIGEGLSRYPRSPGLYAARGSVVELGVAVEHPNLRWEEITDDRRRGRATRALEQAAADYRHALALNPRFDIARLRIAWVHIVLHDGRAAGELLELIKVTTDDSIRYLAHLFRGGLAERNGRLDEARGEYEKARQAGPRFQTACVALSHLEGARGNAETARMLALECAASQHDEDPWWWLGAFDPQTADWLHAEARR